MELNDLIFLGACSILGTKPVTKEVVDHAIKAAKVVWLEVLEHDRKDD